MTPVGENQYDLLVTAVTERADLFIECTESLLAMVDRPPARLIVHEDVRRPGPDPGAIDDWLLRLGLPCEHQVTDPARGQGPAVLWCYERAAERTGTQPIALHTQDDWRALRPIPIKRALALMEAHGLNHIRFNKRKTMRAKHADTDHPWEKVEVAFPHPDGSGIQVLCVSDHWYTQTSLWRVAEALPGLREAVKTAQASEAFVARFNDWMNRQAGLDKKTWNQQALRHERLRTYIWGPVAEPAFVRHDGSRRGTGLIKDHLGEHA